MRELGLPELLEVSGKIVGVEFPPGISKVKIRFTEIQEDSEAGDSAEHTVTCAATEDQVELALRLRKAEVSADILRIDRSHKLLQLRASGDPIPTAGDFSEDVARTHKERWANVLRELA